MAFACHRPMGKDMWQTSDAETVGNVVAHCSGIYPQRRMDSRPFYRKQHHWHCRQSSWKTFLGIDKEEEYLMLSQNRKREIEQISNFTLFRKKIRDIALLDEKELLMVKEEDIFNYDLPF